MIVSIDRTGVLNANANQNEKAKILTRGSAQRERLYRVGRESCDLIFPGLWQISRQSERTLSTSALAIVEYRENLGS